MFKSVETESELGGFWSGWVRQRPLSIIAFETIRFRLLFKLPRDTDFKRLTTNFPCIKKLELNLGNAHKSCTGICLFFNFKNHLG